MKKNLLVLTFVLIGLILTLASCQHEHEWTEWKTIQEPTCSAEGEQERTCECGEMETKAIEKLAHTEAVDEAVAPTCTTVGKTEGTHCSVCSEVLVAQTTVAARGHTEVIDTAVAPTCTTVGKTEGTHCSVCNEVILAQIALSAKGHTEVIDAAVTPTCTRTGLTEGKHCSVCNELLVAQQTIDALGHTDIVDAAVAPTCIRTGLTEGKHCSVCNEVLVAQTTVDALGHTDVIDAAIAPTCIKNGLTEGKHCSVCNEVIIAQNVILASHTQGEWITINEATCTEKGSKHQLCSVCNDVINTEVIDALGHDYTISLTKKTCVIESKLTYICSKCNHTYDEPIDPFNVSIQSVGTSSSTVNGYGRFSKTYKIGISGGYGNLSVAIELYASETATSPSNIVNSTDKSINYTISYTGYSYTSDAYRVKIIITDQAGNREVWLVSLKDFSVISKEILVGECNELTAENDITYINTYGFGKYVCNECHRVAYKDCDGKELEVADLVLSSDATAIMSCNNIDTAEILIIPDTVNLVAYDNLFVYCDNLRHILFGEKSIDLNLQGSPIKHIYVPSHVTVSLSSCNELETVIWGDGVEKIDSYGNFTGCMGRSLHYSSIQKIVIPKSITTIKYDVFRNANKLTTVYYMGNAEEWNDITIEAEGNIFLLEATRYYYSESQPTESANYWHYVDGVPTVW